MHYGIFEQILTIIALSVVIIAIFRRLGLPSILGYLAVGLLIAFIDRYSFQDLQQYNVLAKYGVVFLLFTIGLEFSLKKLFALKRIVFLLGGLQVVVCTLVYWVLGYLAHMNKVDSFIIAATLSMSSTALISKILSESGEVQTHTGRMAIGVLIFQDIMVVPLLIVVSILANNGNPHLVSKISVELAVGILTFITLYIVGKLIITPILKEVARARSNELFVLTALLVALAAAYFTDAMGMSKELGAFLAGVIIAGTPYHKQVATDIRPFRDMLLGLFFIGIGLSLNINALPDTIGWIILTGVIIVVVKFALIPLLILLLKLSNRQQAFRTGLLLAQGGEFGFVLMAVASQFKLIQDFDAQIVLGGIILSMILSLVLIQFQKPMHSFLTRYRKNKGSSQPLEDIIANKQHIIICGFGYTGQQLAKILKAAELPFCAIDIDASCVSQAELAGEIIFYGNATNRDLLLAVGLRDATAVVVCFNEENAAKEINEIMQTETSRTPLIIRTKSKRENFSLSASSTVQLIDEGIEIGLLLGQQVLQSVGLNQQKITQITHSIRDKMGYDVFRGEELLVSDENIAEPFLYAFRINKDAGICGKPIKQLDIDLEKITLKGIRSPDKSTREATPDTILQAQDVLILSGPLDDIEALEEQLA